MSVSHPTLATLSASQTVSPGGLNITIVRHSDAVKFIEKRTDSLSGDIATIRFTNPQNVVSLKLQAKKLFPTSLGTYLTGATDAILTQTAATASGDLSATHNNGAAIELNFTGVGEYKYFTVANAMNGNNATYPLRLKVTKVDQYDDNFSGETTHEYRLSWVALGTQGDSAYIASADTNAANERFGMYTMHLLYNNQNSTEAVGRFGLLPNITTFKVTAPDAQSTNLSTADDFANEDLCGTFTIAAKTGSSALRNIATLSQKFTFAEGISFSGDASLANESIFHVRVNPSAYTNNTDTLYKVRAETLAFTSAGVATNKNGCTVFTWNNVADANTKAASAQFGRLLGATMDAAQVGGAAATVRHASKVNNLVTIVVNGEGQTDTTPSFTLLPLQGQEHEITNASVKVRAFRKMPDAINAWDAIATNAVPTVKHSMTLLSSMQDTTVSSTGGGVLTVKPPTKLSLSLGQLVGGAGGEDVTFAGTSTLAESTSEIILSTGALRAAGATIAKTAAKTFTITLPVTEKDISFADATKVDLVTNADDPAVVNNLDHSKLSITMTDVANTGGKLITGTSTGADIPADIATANYALMGSSANNSVKAAFRNLDGEFDKLQSADATDAKTGVYVNTNVMGSHAGSLVITGKDITTKALKIGQLTNTHGRDVTVSVDKEAAFDTAGNRTVTVITGHDITGLAQNDVISQLGNTNTKATVGSVDANAKTVTLNTDYEGHFNVFSAAGNASGAGNQTTTTGDLVKQVGGAFHLLHDNTIILTKQLGVTGSTADNDADATETDLLATDQIIKDSNGVQGKIRTIENGASVNGLNNNQIRLTLKENTGYIDNTATPLFRNNVAMQTNEFSFTTLASDNIAQGRAMTQTGTVTDSTISSVVATTANGDGTTTYRVKANVATYANGVTAFDATSNISVNDGSALKELKYQEITLNGTGAGDSAANFLQHPDNTSNFLKLDDEIGGKEIKAIIYTLTLADALTGERAKGSAVSMTDAAGILTATAANGATSISVLVNSNGDTKPFTTGEVTIAGEGATRTCSAVSTKLLVDLGTQAQGGAVVATRGGNALRTKMQSVTVDTQNTVVAAVNDAATDGTATGTIKKVTTVGNNTTYLIRPNAGNANNFSTNSSMTFNNIKHKSQKITLSDEMRRVHGTTLDVDGNTAANNDYAQREGAANTATARVKRVANSKELFMSNNNLDNAFKAITTVATTTSAASAGGSHKDVVVASAANIVVGMKVTGAGIPKDTRVKAINGTTITMSALSNDADKAVSVGNGQAIKFHDNTLAKNSANLGYLELDVSTSVDAGVDFPVNGGAAVTITQAGTNATATLETVSNTNAANADFDKKIVSKLSNTHLTNGFNTSGALSVDTGNGAGAIAVKYQKLVGVPESALETFSALNASTLVNEFTSPATSQLIQQLNAAGAVVAEGYLREYTSTANNTCTLRVQLKAGSSDFVTTDNFVLKTQSGANANTARTHRYATLKISNEHATFAVDDKLANASENETISAHIRSKTANNDNTTSYVAEYTTAASAGDFGNTSIFKVNNGAANDLQSFQTIVLDGSGTTPAQNEVWRQTTASGVEALGTVASVTASNIIKLRLHSTNAFAATGNATTIAFASTITRSTAQITINSAGQNGTLYRLVIAGNNCDHTPNGNDADANATASALGVAIAAAIPNTYLINVAQNIITISGPNTGAQFTYNGNAALAGISSLANDSAITTTNGVAETSGLSGQATVKLANVNSIFAGMGVSGTGVAANARVTQINGTTITLSANLTQQASGNYTFTKAFFKTDYSANRAVASIEAAVTLTFGAGANNVTTDVKPATAAASTALTPNGVEMVYLHAEAIDAVVDNKPSAATNASLTASAVVDKSALLKNPGTSNAYTGANSSVSFTKGISTAATRLVPASITDPDFFVYPNNADGANSAVSAVTSKTYSAVASAQDLAFNFAIGSYAKQIAAFRFRVKVTSAGSEEYFNVSVQTFSTPELFLSRYLSEASNNLGAPTYVTNSVDATTGANAGKVIDGSNAVVNSGNGKKHTKWQIWRTDAAANNDFYDKITTNNGTSRFCELSVRLGGGLSNYKGALASESLAVASFSNVNDAKHITFKHRSEGYDVYGTDGNALAVDAELIKLINGANDGGDVIKVGANTYAINAATATIVGGQLKVAFPNAVDVSGAAVNELLDLNTANAAESHSRFKLTEAGGADVSLTSTGPYVVTVTPGTGWEHDEADSADPYKENVLLLLKDDVDQKTYSVSTASLGLLIANSTDNNRVIMRNTMNGKTLKVFREDITAPASEHQANGMPIFFASATGGDTSFRFHLKVDSVAKTARQGTDTNWTNINGYTYAPDGIFTTTTDLTNGSTGNDPSVTMSASINVKNSSGSGIGDDTNTDEKHVLTYSAVQTFKDVTGDSEFAKQNGVTIGSGFESTVEIIRTAQQIEGFATGSATSNGATVTNGSANVTLAGANAAIKQGMVVTGDGIPVGTTVQSINGTALVLSAAASGNQNSGAASTNLSFSETYTAGINVWDTGVPVNENLATKSLNNKISISYDAKGLPIKVHQNNANTLLLTTTEVNGAYNWTDLDSTEAAGDVNVRSITYGLSNNEASYYRMGERFITAAATNQTETSTVTVSSYNNGTRTVTLVAVNDSYVAGLALTGTNVEAGTTIQSINGTSLVLSQACPDLVAQNVITATTTNTKRYFMTTTGISKDKLTKGYLSSTGRAATEKRTAPGGGNITVATAIPAPGVSGAQTTMNVTVNDATNIQVGDAIPTLKGTESGGPDGAVLDVPLYVQSKNGNELTMKSDDDRVTSIKAIAQGATLDVYKVYEVITADGHVYQRSNANPALPNDVNGELISFVTGQTTGGAFGGRSFASNSINVNVYRSAHFSLTDGVTGNAARSSVLATDRTLGAAIPASGSDITVSSAANLVPGMMVLDTLTGAVKNGDAGVKDWTRIFDADTTITNVNGTTVTLSKAPLRTGATTNGKKITFHYQPERTLHVSKTGATSTLLKRNRLASNTGLTGISGASVLSWDGSTADHGSATDAPTLNAGSGIISIDATKVFSAVAGGNYTKTATLKITDTNTTAVGKTINYGNGHVSCTQRVKVNVIPDAAMAVTTGHKADISLFDKFIVTDAALFDLSYNYFADAFNTATVTLTNRDKDANANNAVGTTDASATVDGNATAVNLLSTAQNTPVVAAAAIKASGATQTSGGAGFLTIKAGYVAATHQPLENKITYKVSITENTISGSAAFTNIGTNVLLTGKPSGGAAPAYATTDQEIGVTRFDNPSVKQLSSVAQANNKTYNHDTATQPANQRAVWTFTDDTAKGLGGGSAATTDAYHNIYELHKQGGAAYQHNHAIFTNSGTTFPQSVITLVQSNGFGSVKTGGATDPARYASSISTSASLTPVTNDITKCTLSLDFKCDDLDGKNSPTSVIEYDFKDDLTIKAHPHIRFKHRGADGTGFSDGTRQNVQLGGNNSLEEADIITGKHSGGSKNVPWLVYTTDMLASGAGFADFEEDGNGVTAIVTDETVQSKTGTTGGNASATITLNNTTGLAIGDGVTGTGVAGTAIGGVNYTTITAIAGNNITVANSQTLGNGTALTIGKHLSLVAVDATNGTLKANFNSPLYADDQHKKVILKRELTGYNGPGGLAMDADSIRLTILRTPAITVVNRTGTSIYTLANTQTVHMLTDGIKTSTVHPITNKKNTVAFTDFEAGSGNGTFNDVVLAHPQIGTAGYEKEKGGFWNILGLGLTNGGYPGFNFANEYAVAQTNNTFFNQSTTKGKIGFFNNASASDVVTSKAGAGLGSATPDLVNADNTLNCIARNSTSNAIEDHASKTLADIDAKGSAFLVLGGKRRTKADTLTPSNINNETYTLTNGMLVAFDHNNESTDNTVLVAPPQLAYKAGAQPTAASTDTANFTYKVTTSKLLSTGANATSTSAAAALTLKILSPLNETLHVADVVTESTYSSSDKTNSGFTYVANTNTLTDTTVRNYFYAQDLNSKLLAVYANLSPGSTLAAATGQKTLSTSYENLHSITAIATDGDHATMFTHDSEGGNGLKKSLHLKLTNAQMHTNFKAATAKRTITTTIKPNGYSNGNLTLKSDMQMSRTTLVESLINGATNNATQLGDMTTVLTYDGSNWQKVTPDRKANGSEKWSAHGSGTTDSRYGANYTNITGASLNTEGTGNSAKTSPVWLMATLDSTSEGHRFSNQLIFDNITFNTGTNVTADGASTGWATKYGSKTKAANTKGDITGHETVYQNYYVDGAKVANLAGPNWTSAATHRMNPTVTIADAFKRPMTNAGDTFNADTDTTPDGIAAGQAVTIALVSNKYTVDLNLSKTTPQQITLSSKPSFKRHSTDAALGALDTDISGRARGKIIESSASGNGAGDTLGIFTKGTTKLGNRIVVFTDLSDLRDPSVAAGTKQLTDRENRFELDTTQTNGVTGQTEGVSRYVDQTVRRRFEISEADTGDVVTFKVLLSGEDAFYKKITTATLKLDSITDLQVGDHVYQSGLTDSINGTQYQQTFGQIVSINSSLNTLEVEFAGNESTSDPSNGTFLAANGDSHNSAGARRGFTQPSVDASNVEQIPFIVSTGNATKLTALRGFVGAPGEWNNLGTTAAAGTLVGAFQGYSVTQVTINHRNDAKRRLAINSGMIGTNHSNNHDWAIYAPTSGTTKDNGFGEQYSDLLITGTGSSGFSIGENTVSNLTNGEYNHTDLGDVVISNTFELNKSLETNAGFGVSHLESDIYRFTLSTTGKDWRNAITVTTAKTPNNGQNQVATGSITLTTWDFSIVPGLYVSGGAIPTGSVINTVNAANKTITLVSDGTVDNHSLNNVNIAANTTVTFSKNLFKTMIGKSSAILSTSHTTFITRANEDADIVFIFRPVASAIAGSNTYTTSDTQIIALLVAGLDKAANPAPESIPAYALRLGADSNNGEEAKALTMRVVGEGVSYRKLQPYYTMQTITPKLSTFPHSVLPETVFTREVFFKDVQSSSTAFDVSVSPGGADLIANSDGTGSGSTTLTLTDATKAAAQAFTKVCSVSAAKTVTTLSVVKLSASAAVTSASSVTVGATTPTAANSALNGMTLLRTTADIPVGTTVSAEPNGNTISLSGNVSVAQDQELYFVRSAETGTFISLVNSVTSGAQILTLNAADANIVAGMTVSGPCIAPGTVITAKSGNSLTLSKKTTAAYDIETGDAGGRLAFENTVFNNMTVTKAGNIVAGTFASSFTNGNTITLSGNASNAGEEQTVSFSHIGPGTYVVKTNGILADTHVTAFDGNKTITLTKNQTTAADLALTFRSDTQYDNLAATSTVSKFTPEAYIYRSEKHLKTYKIAFNTTTKLLTLSYQQGIDQAVWNSTSTSNPLKDSHGQALVKDMRYLILVCAYNQQTISANATYNGYYVWQGVTSQEQTDASKRGAFLYDTLSTSSTDKFGMSANRPIPSSTSAIGPYRLLIIPSGDFTEFNSNGPNLAGTGAVFTTSAPLASNDNMKEKSSSVKRQRMTQLIPHSHTVQFTKAQDGPIYRIQDTPSRIDHSDIVIVVLRESASTASSSLTLKYDRIESGDNIQAYQLRGPLDYEGQSSDVTLDSIMSGITTIMPRWFINDGTEVSVVPKHINLSRGSGQIGSSTLTSYTTTRNGQSVTVTPDNSLFVDANFRSIQFLSHPRSRMSLQYARATNNGSTAAITPASDSDKTVYNTQEIFRYRPENTLTLEEAESLPTFD